MIVLVASVTGWGAGELEAMGWQRFIRYYDATRRTRLLVKTDDG